MKILFLDDNQYRIFTAVSKLGKDNDLHVVTTAKEAIEMLEDHVFDVVYLDHDLGVRVYQSSDEENCGMEVVRWIIKNLPPIDKIVIHSWNIPAAKQMWKMLYSAGYKVVRQTFNAGILR